MLTTRQHILDVAATLFLQKSYYEVTLQDILGASGLSKGAFYHHFRSKEQVFEEVIEAFFGTAPVEDFGRLSHDSLRDFCQDYARLIAERVRQYAARTGDVSGVLRANQYALVFDAMNILPAFRARQQQRHQRELEAWLHVIGQARERGEIASPLSDEQVARLFIYQHYGIGVYHVLRTQVEELTREVAAQFEGLYALLRA